MTTITEATTALDAVCAERGLYYCSSSETLGLGQCQCNSHPWCGRIDGSPASEEDLRAVCDAAWGGLVSGWLPCRESRLLAELGISLRIKAQS
jgi:hypothetical protein